MKIIGITGGIGAGKSTVLNYMAKEYGARVIQADQVGHKLLEPGNACYHPVIELLGSAVIADDGSIDRQEMARIIFEDETKREKVNQIIHPAVKEYIKQEIARERKERKVPFVAIEAALLIEDHYEEICDQLWYIYAEKNVRIQRLNISRNYSEDRAVNVMKRQLSDEEFRSHCQVILDNSSENLEVTKNQIDKELKKHEIM